MDEFFCVSRVNDLRERKDRLGNDAPMLSATAGNHHFAGLVSPFYCVEDNVLLQHAIIAEGCLSRIKDVDSAKLQVVQKVFAKRTEIRAIAKTPRCDSDQLPTGNQQPMNKRDEASVKIARLDPYGAKSTPFG